MTDMIHRVDFWFDPVCPYSWTASRWLEEVRELVPLEVNYHVMSLRISNEASDESDDYKAVVARSVGPSRIATAAAVEHGEAVLRGLYTAFGGQIFDKPRFPEPAEYRDAMNIALAVVGLPVKLLDAGDTDRYDEVLRRSHEAGVGPVGGRTAGTPTIHLDGAAFFGPVLQSIPRGADAVRLLSGLQLLAASPSFYELKRDRTTMPVFG